MIDHTTDQIKQIPFHYDSNKAKEKDREKHLTKSPKMMFTGDSNEYLHFDDNMSSAH